ncbi:NAD(P)/FAD-dependent oxidoreductase [Novosphingobium sp. SG707]|uniref:flavin monoamine oxidase family protein n=1 Tax=Novosphingobium sp. SG707 TaxID=2586996 RepID=UPI001445F831|nr:NAD(P)/FAD-dependent oxidoreductase [Novosphingobium sp. SG707]NKJ02030.1 monoamine oxidase [Novosphingobium sp. SG707]
MMQTDVAIIGAGVAGLRAAGMLQKAGVSCAILDARDRIGGRIVTVDADGQPSEDGFDLGPSWFWPGTQPDIGRLVEELGLASFLQHSDGDVVFERMAREPSHRFRPINQEPQSRRLVGGSATLIRALAAQVAPDSIRLNTRVIEARLTDEGAVLTTLDADGRTDILHAMRIVAALPPRLLAAHVQFLPAQRADTIVRWQATPTWMAPHAKFFAFYDRPFWREAGLSGTAQSMVGPMVEMHDATTATGEAALMGFIGVPAEQRAARGEADLTAACLAQLARIFGAEAQAPQATLIKDWAADPLTATSADRFAGGYIAPSDRPWVAGPWAQHLFLAGSETSAVEPGYLAGAVMAAERAARVILSTGQV